MADTTYDELYDYEPTDEELASTGPCEDAPCCGCCGAGSGGYGDYLLRDEPPEDPYYEEDGYLCHPDAGYDEEAGW